MNKIWYVATQEYQRNVFKKSFIFVLLSVPFFITLMIGLGHFIESSKDNPLPIGYVDYAGFFQTTTNAPALRASWIEDQDQAVEIIPYVSEGEARTALESGQIQAYYIVPVDYVSTRHVEQVYIDKPGENAWRQFFDFLQINLLSSQPPEIAYRVAAGTGVTVRSMDGRREIPSGGPTFGLLMPLFITMAFLFMLLMSSGYTMSAVADEKENRTMEMLVTSISPTQLISGKILGIVAVGLTLLLVWTGVILLGVAIASRLGVGWFSDLSLDWRVILSTVAIAVPAYALSISLMTAIGAMVTSTQEGQSVSAIFFILHLAPLYISWSFLNDPHGALSVVLTLLPLTTLMTTGMRNLFTIVPAWQVYASMIIQSVCLLGALWLAGRSLRLGMLRYGQRLTWRSLFSSQSSK